MKSARSLLKVSFLSLFEGDQVLEERALLSYLFAISLERKRILKSSPVTDEDTVQVFTHVKTKRTFDIPIVVPSKASAEIAQDDQRNKMPCSEPIDY